MRLTTARYYTPSGRSIQNLGVSPDILVEQRPQGVETADEESKRKQRTEAGLRGSLSNDSLTEDEKNQLQEERRLQEETAKKRDEDYQMSYALDLLRGLSVLKKAN